MQEFVLPALLVLLSSVLRSFIVNKKSTLSVIGEIGVGLPVDLTFVVLSIAISSAKLTPDWINSRPNLIIATLVVAVIQLGAIYKPCKEYIDEDQYWKSFGLWTFNAIVTFLVFCFFVFKVVTL